MNQKINGHTADFLKRQAKAIAKQQNIPHHQALDQAAKEAGFGNWQHFVNADKLHRKPAKAIKTKTASVAIPNKVKATPIRKKVNPYRNLLVAGINELLKNKVISLDSKSSDSSPGEQGYFATEIFGFPSMVIWRDIGFEELIISVWWKYDHSLHPQANLTGNKKENFHHSSPLAKRSHYKNFVGITASGWLERRTGKYIQGKDNERLIDIYTRSGEKAALEKLPIQKPNGFETHGKFYF